MLVSRAGLHFVSELQKHFKMQFSTGFCDFEPALCGLEADLFTNMKL
jgi:hypothetical protein